MKPATLFFVVTALAGMLPCAQSLAQEEASPPEAQPAVKVIGLVVAKPDDTGAKYSGYSFPPLGPGVTLLLEASAPGSYLVKMVPDECELTTFRDGKGNDLGLAKKWLDDRPEFLEGRSACRFTIHADRLPSPDARSVEVDGRAVFQIGREEKTSEATVDLRVGKEIELTAGALQIRKLEIADSRKSMFRVTLYAEATFDAIKEIAFLDADGQAVEHRLVMTSYDGKSHTFAFDRIFEQLTIRCVHFAELEKISYPLAVKVSAGLAAAERRAAEEGIDVENVALTVAVPLPDDRQGRSVLRSVPPGVALRFRLRAPSVNLLEMDRDASRLDLFRDDAGTDLSRESGWLAEWPRLSDDGHVCEVEIRSSSLPAPTAKAVEAKAGVVFLVGSEETTDTVSLKLEEGAEFTLGELPVRISNIALPKSGRRKVEINFSAGETLARITDVVFQDASGKVVESKSTGSSRSRMGNNVTHSKSYGLYRKAEEVTMKITYFAKVDPVTVPVEAKVAAGLAGAE